MDINKTAEVTSKTRNLLYVTKNHDNVYFPIPCTNSLSYFKFETCNYISLQFEV
jgi:hypothetical protein